LSADATGFLIYNLMGANIPLDANTGLAALSFVTTLQTQFVQTYMDPLVASNDISAPASGTQPFVIVGTPNGASTINWTYTLLINGTPITGSVVGQVKFT